MMMQRGVPLSLLSILYISSHAPVMANLMPKSFFVPDIEQWAMNLWSYVLNAQHSTSPFPENPVHTCYIGEQSKDAITFCLLKGIIQLSSEIAEIEKSITFPETKLKTLSEMMNKISKVYRRLINTVGLKPNPTLNLTQICRFAHDELYIWPLWVKLNVLHQNLKENLPDFSVFSSGQSGNREITECGAGHSPSDDLHSIYISVILAQMKAYVLNTFNHHVLSSYDGSARGCTYAKKNPNTEMQGVQKKLMFQLYDYNKIFLRKMSKLSREFRTCDEENFARDETYFELEGAIQSIAHYSSSSNESFLNANKAVSCEDITTAGVPESYCHSRQKLCITPMVRSCLGSIHNCESVKACIGCLAQEYPRRYSYFITSGDFLFDPNFRRSEFAGLVCSPAENLFYLPAACWCKCNDNHVDSVSTHIFNLQWVQSDISQNMVITGVRFIVQHRIMQLQIQQGILDTHFRVREPKWKPVNDISERVRAARINRKLRGQEPGVTESVDFMVIKDGYNNAINFDTLMVPHSHALTGVRFQISTREGSLQRIEIALSATQFDHQSGKLCLKCPQHIEVSTTIHKSRYQYPNEFIHSPKFPTTPKTSNNQYTLIDKSDQLHDSGQTTLPLFDALPLVSDGPAPLGGIGIFHKTKDDFTGFISLKFLSLDYSQYMKA